MKFDTLAALADDMGILFDDTREVLIVEDDEDLSQVVATVLESKALEPVVFHDPRRALDDLENHQFAVALVDFHLPKMNGLELARCIEELSPDTIPIMMTGDVRTDTLIEAIRAGVHDYLVKPFESITLVGERVSVAVELHNERRRAEQLARFLHDANKGLERARDEIDDAQQEIEMFNRVLEAKVEQRTRQHAASTSQLAGMKDAIGLISSELNELIGTVRGLSARVVGAGAHETTGMEDELLRLLADIRRIAKRTDKLAPEGTLAGPAFMKAP